MCFSVFDACAAGSSGCEQRCLTSPRGFSCDCYLGFVLNADRKTCRKGCIFWLFSETVLILTHSVTYAVLEKKNAP